MALPRVIQRGGLPKPLSFLRQSSRLSQLSSRARTRCYSLKVDTSSSQDVAGLDPAQLSIAKSTTPKDLLPPEELVFGRTFTGSFPDRDYIKPFLTL